MVRYYVKQFGGVWSMDRGSFERFLENGAAGMGWDLNDYGHEVKRAPSDAAAGRIVKPIGRPDWSAETFQNALEQLRRTGRVY